MRSVGFVVLAHDNIFRLRQTLRYLANEGVPIAVHLDEKAPRHQREALQYFFQNEPRIYWAEPINCHWGHWSIVEAQIRTTKLLLENEPELDYVYHISGSCLPLRPIEELREFLSGDQPPIDYVESVALGDRQWVVHGLDRERLEFYHPFNWQTNRRLFDLSVSVQRLLKFNRKLPQDLTPCFGSQWWCLSTKTIERIFHDENFEKYCNFFKYSWIPDESFFQTLARKHSPRIDSRSLTFATFDSAGKPYLIYDDHAPILRRLDRFFIRKIWRGADALYNEFLDQDRKLLKRDKFAELEMESLLENTTQNRKTGRVGLLAQFVNPVAKQAQKTRSIYYIYVGFQSVREQIYKYFLDSPVIAQMGFLFHPSRTEFEIDAKAKPVHAHHLFKFRDYEKWQFLKQRIWHGYPRNVAFMAKPHHLKRLNKHLAVDANCHLVVVRGAWLIDLYQRNLENIERLRTVCKIEMMREDKMFFELNKVKSKQANIRTFDLWQLIIEPYRVERAFPEEFNLEAPKIDYGRFVDFIDKLEANGVSLSTYETHRIKDFIRQTGSGSEDGKVVSIVDYDHRKKA